MVTQQVKKHDKDIDLKKKKTLIRLTKKIKDKE